MELSTLVGHEVRVVITREPWGDCFNLLLDNGYSEELEPDETRQWFKDHGVTESERLESALDMAWNFYHHIITIVNFQVPAVAHPAYMPKI